MRDEVWASIRALGEKRAQDRRYARFYESMPEDRERPRRPASASQIDTPHDSWKDRYAPDPWIDQVLLPVRALSFKVPLSAALRETLQLLQPGARAL